MEHQINGMKSTAACLLFFLLITCFSSAAYAVGGEGILKEKLENNPADVHLYGIGKFEAVQLFGFLLAEVPGISELSQTEMRLKPGDPDACHASWSVRIKNGDIDYLQSQLYNMIKDLDPDRQNDTLKEVPFSVMEEDMTLLKQVKPVLASAGYLAFGYNSIANEVDLTEGSGRPWYKQPGAGFE